MGLSVRVTTPRDRFDATKCTDHQEHAMRPFAHMFVLCGLLASVGFAHGQDAVANAELADLERALRPLIVHAIPNVLYEKSENWGHQAKVVNGLKWRGLEPRLQKGYRNDGRWRKTVVTPRNLENTFDLKLSKLRNLTADTQAFDVDLSMMVNVQFDQQNWESGLRLFSGTIRARVRVKTHLECENTIVLDYSKGLLPDLLMRLRVTKASVGYDNLVVEHLPGFGGSAAEVMGDAFHTMLKQWKPSVERDLLNRASSALVKAADTREIRVGLSKFLPQASPKK